MNMNGLIENEMPIFLWKRAKLTPNRVAVQMSETALTFQELHEKALELAGKMAAAGMKKGQYIGILSPNSVEMIVMIHALKYVGAITVMLNTKLSPSEVSFQLEDAKVSHLLVDSSLRDKGEQSAKGSPVTVHSFEELQRMTSASIDPIKTISLGDTDTIMYTSGTTGAPKGVKQTYGNHWWSAIGSSLNLGLREDDCWLIAVPLFHISGLSILMRSVIYGMKVILHEKFDASRMNRAIHEEGVTIVSVVTAMVSKLLQEENGAPYPASFRCMLVGGGPVPVTILEKCSSLNIPVYQTYGMTETSSQIVTLSPEDSLQKIGSAGKALFPSEVMIMSETEEQQHDNLPGEIVVKGPNVTGGYLNRPDATAGTIRDGWLHTGDIGYMDEEGFLYVLDRRSDLIISGGENIYPAEIENVLVKHHDVVEAGVTGLKDETWGQVPVAFVVVNSDDVEEKDILAHCLTHLAKYKVPKHVHFVKNLPRNASNKLLRRELFSLLD